MVTIVGLHYFIGNLQLDLTACSTRVAHTRNAACRFRTAAKRRASTRKLVSPREPWGQIACLVSSLCRGALQRMRWIVKMGTHSARPALAISKGGSSLHTVSWLSSRMLLLALSLLLYEPTQAAAAKGSRSVDKICSLIESSARTNNLPVDFLTRLIWTESRLKPDVLGATTKDGQRAEGIAQFMPATAAEHKLIEPFNPVEALPKSAEFLAQLRDQFGNLGLAAAAYNAGPKRVQDYLAGMRALPMETRKYVLTITGKPVQAWAKPITQQQNRTNISDGNSEALNLNCQDVVAHLEQQEPRSATLEKSGLAAQMNRNVPSWCSGLRHPNVSECGEVHMPLSPAKSTTALRPSVREHFPRTRI